MRSIYLAEPEFAGLSDGNRYPQQLKRLLSIASAYPLINRRIAVFFYFFMMLYAATLTAAVTPAGAPASKEAPNSSAFFTCYLRASAIVKHVNCYGYKTGSIDLSVSGAYGTVYYKWYKGASTTPFATTQDVFNLSAGNYKVVIKDKRCTIIKYYTVDSFSPIVVKKTYFPPILCYGGRTTLTVYAEGKGELQYSLNGGAYQSSNTFANLAAGTYKVCVRYKHDTYNKCVCCVTVVIPPGKPIVIKPIVFKPILCPGGTTDLTIYASGAGELLYSLNGGAYQSSNTFANLVAGTYKVCVKYKHDYYEKCVCCVTVVIPDGKPIVIKPPHYKPILCPGGTTDLTIYASGAGDLLYSLNGGTYQSSNTFANLAAGKYLVCVKYKYDYYEKCKVCFEVTIPDGKPIVIKKHYFPPILCAGGKTTLTVEAEGAGELLYSLNGGAYQSSNTFAGLTAGTYKVCVKYKHDYYEKCVCCITIVIPDGKPIVIKKHYFPPILCVGGKTTLTVEAEGEDLEYSLNGGAYQSSNTFAGLTAGTYTVCVRYKGVDYNKCDCVEDKCKVCFVVVIPDGKPIVVVCGPSKDASSPEAADGELTVEAEGEDLEYSLNGGAYQSSSTFTGLKGGKYTICVRYKGVDYDKCDCAEDKCKVCIECEVKVKPPKSCEGFRTQTQGGYGQEPNGNNVGTYVQANFANAFPNGVTVGCATNNTLTLTSAAAVRAFLPSGTMPRALEQDLTDPTRDTYRNVFAGQVVALSLSIGFDNYDPNFAPSDVNLEDLIVTEGPFAGWTVGEVLAEANKKLGGCGSSYSFSQLSDALANINQCYVDGKSSCGYLKCPPKPCNTCPGSTPTARVGVGAEAGGVGGLQLQASPNPFYNKATIQFSVTQTTDATVDVYSITGAKISTLFKGKAEAGHVYKVEFKGVDARGQGLKAGTYIYQLSTPTSAKHGRLIFMNR